MAFVNQPTQEEINQGLTGAPAAPLTGGTGGVSGASPSSTATPSAPQEKGGTQFADVSRYLTQNQPAGQRFASRIGGNVIQAGNEARGAIGAQQGNLGNARNTFNQNFQANQPVGANQELLDRVAKSPTSFFNAPARDPGRGGWAGAFPTKTYSSTPTSRVQYQGPTNSPYSELTDPLTATNQGDIDAYQSMLNASYGGPQDLGFDVDYSAINPLAQKAGGISDQYKTFTGREDLLGGLNKSNYSDAAKNLDAILLGAAPSRNILKGASNQNADISTQLGALRDLESSAKGEAAGKVAGAQEQAAGVRGQARGAGEEAYGALKEDYGGRLTEAQKASTDLLNRWNPIPGAGGGTEESDLYNKNLAYGQKNLEDLNIQNVGTEDDYLKLAALNQLMGTNYGL